MAATVHGHCDAMAGDRSLMNLSKGDRFPRSSQVSRSRVIIGGNLMSRHQRRLL
ncbi:MAG: hypothetical protein WBA43_16295 [Elainellaceae cyanobacterium]